MRHRFFVRDAGAPGTTIVLPAEEAAHARRVLRLRPGAAVVIFDGRGRECTGEIVEAGSRVQVRIEKETAALPEPAVAVLLAHAVLKGDKMDGVVRDAVMMGAAAILPLVTRYSETSLAALARGGRVDRWRRVAVSSAKQCGRAVLPAVLEPVDLAPAAGFFDRVSLPVPRLVLIEPGAQSSKPATAASVPRPAQNRATLLVGPEGGWAPEEVEAFERLCVPISLGPRTLRADAAAVVAIAALFAVWGVDG